MQCRDRLRMMKAAYPLAVVVLILGVLGLHGQASGPALTGLVRSAEEGPMEGVLVSAQRSGSIVTVTVVTDATGHYSFPRNRLEPGPHSLKIRAAGYDLVDPRTVQVAASKTASADLTLRKTKDVSTQLSNAEWLLSMPGGDEQKSFL